MQKKILSVAVATALSAPTVGMAEAILYGKLNMSLDYENINNQIQPIYNNSPAPVWVSPNGTYTTTNTPGAMQLDPGNTWKGEDFSGWSVNRGRNLQGSPRANRLGVKGSEDLGNGFKAIYQVEFGVNMANEGDNDITNNEKGRLNNQDSAVTMRNSFAGLAGDWGTFLIGRNDTPLKTATAKLDQFADTMADYNGTIGFQDYRADNSVAYISPSLAGFQLSAALIPTGGATADSSNNYNLNSNQISGGYSLAGIYSNGPFFASVAYESLNEELFMSSATSMNGCPTINDGYNSCNKIDDSQDTWKIGLGLLDWNGFTVAAVYEQQDNLPVVQMWGTNIGDAWNLPGGPDERKLWQLQAGYSFGNFMIKGMYGQSSYDGSYLPSLYEGRGVDVNTATAYRNIAKDYYEGSSSSWALGVDYNFSKRTKAYALYTETNSDAGDVPTFVNTSSTGPIYKATQTKEWDGFSVGLMHSF